MIALVAALMVQASLQAGAGLAAEAVVPATPADAPAAAHADFSGVWTLDYTRSETMAAGGRIDRGPLTIAHTGEAFTVTSSAAGERPVAYAMVAPGAKRVANTTGGSAYWEGHALVTELDGTVNGKSVVVKQSRTLSPDRREMVVETTLAIQHGYAPGEDLPKSVAQDVYVRAGP